jgi:DNA-binding transcriptional ArsR family regulator
MNAFALVAEPTRRRILDLLLNGEQPVNRLADELGASQPTVPKHLRVLREAGVVSVRVDAQHRRYRLEPAALEEIDEWIAPYRRLWADRLEALGAYLDRDAAVDRRAPGPPEGSRPTGVGRAKHAGRNTRGRAVPGDGAG